LATARSRHTATLLPNGLVLVAGGADNSNPISSCELFNPSTGTWSPAALLNNERAYHTANLLSDGRVLVAGGYNLSLDSVRTSELYDSSTNTWTFTIQLNDRRYQHTGTLLQDGRTVLVIGGFGGSASAILRSAELFTTS
jgi:Galactose oxidase, central domain